VAKALENGVRTADLGGTLSTSAMGECGAGGVVTTRLAPFP